MKNIKDLFFYFLSAVLLIFSFSRLNLWIFAWVGFVPLFFVLRNKSKAKAFLPAYLTGVIFWLGTIYWLVHVTLPGMILLVLYLGLYFGVFGFFVSFSLNRLSFIASLFFLPSIWVVLEYIRSHLLSGFPWALLGYSQYLNLPVIQLADITGVWGVSFLVMMGNVFVYKVLRIVYCVLRKKARKDFSVIGYISFPLVFFLVLSYGFYKIRTTQYAQRNTLKVCVIQGNIPQELKWDISVKEFIIERYFSLTDNASLLKPDMIIWPEAALPTVPQEDTELFERVKNFVKERQIPLLLGAVTKESAAGSVEEFYNGSLFISKNGQVSGKYNKMHLVPFGEYIPLRKIFGFLQDFVPIGDFTAGREYVIFSHRSSGVPEHQVRFSSLICFEDLFPGLSREFTKRGADFLVNITNDAWFKNTSAPYQHLQASVFRAIENRSFVVRAANTGISGFIAPAGKIISLVCDKSGKNTFVDGYKMEEISITARKLSFYTRYGDIFVLFCAGFVVLFIIKKKTCST